MVQSEAPFELVAAIFLLLDAVGNQRLLRAIVRIHADAGMSLCGRRFLQIWP